MKALWFYMKDGKKVGPLTGQQLKDLVASGQLGQSDLVWKDGLIQWVRAKNIKGLFNTEIVASLRDCVPPPLPPEALNHSEILDSHSDNRKLEYLNNISPLLNYIKSIILITLEAIVSRYVKLTFPLKITVCIISMLGLAVSPIVFFSLLFAGRSFTLLNSTGFSQNILNLPLEKKKDFGIPINRKAKPLFPSRSVEDLIQAIYMLGSKSSGDNSILFYDYSHKLNANEKLGNPNFFGINKRKGVIALGRRIPESGWIEVFGKLPAPKISNHDNMHFDEWEFKCVDETVIIVSPSKSKYSSFSLIASPTDILVDSIYFNQELKNYIKMNIIDERSPFFCRFYISKAYYFND